MVNESRTSQYRSLKPFAKPYAPAYSKMALKKVPLVSTQPRIPLKIWIFRPILKPFGAHKVYAYETMIKNDETPLDYEGLEKIISFPDD